MTLRTFQNFPFSAELGFLGPFSSVFWPQALALAAGRALGLGLLDFPRFSRTLQICSHLSWTPATLLHSLLILYPGSSCLAWSQSRLELCMLSKYFCFETICKRKWGQVGEILPVCNWKPVPWVMGQLWLPVRYFFLGAGPWGWGTVPLDFASLAHQASPSPAVGYWDMTGI